MICRNTDLHGYTMSFLPTGSPHFKGFRRQIKQSDYDLMKALCEPIDNIIVKCKNIHLTFRLSDQEKGNLSQLRISDDYMPGFESMFEEGTKNSFNTTHMREGQEDDCETSQFGIGLKAGAISIGDKLNIYTQVKGKFYQIEMDFLEMCERAEDSFSPTVREMTEEEYRSKHPFEYGSTLVFSSIHPTIYGYTTETDFQAYLLKELSDTYNDMLSEHKVALKVNGIMIDCMEDIYETRECAPFTHLFHIYKIEKDYYMSNGSSIYVYDPVTDAAKFIPKKEHPDLSGTNPLASIKSTFTYFSPRIKKDHLPCGVVHLNRNGRRYGSWTSHGSKNNGSKNYNLSRVDFESKYVAKQLGLTFNKDISERLKNKETQAFHCFIDVSVKGYNADTSTSAFTKLLQIAQTENIPVPEERKSLEEPKQPKPKPPKPFLEKPASVPEVHDFIEDVKADKPASIPDIQEFIEIEVEKPHKPKKSVVGPFIKGGLTMEQLTELLSQDKELLKYHPAMIHAYNEIIMKS